MARTKRNFKDGVFKDYFKDKQRLIEAYNAIAEKDYPATTKLEFKNLKNVFFKAPNNDIAFMLDERLIVLLEAQSTINENMPLRMLIYISEIYKGIIKEDALYRKKASKLPTPEFFVIYNGLDKYPEKKILKLSDSFISPAGAPILDLIVTVYNVAEGNSVQMLKQSEALSDYAMFISIAYKNFKFAKTEEKRDEAINKTINYCLEHGIMKAYLKSNGSEVRRMLSMLWNEEINRRVLLEEGEEKGLKRGLKRGRKEGREEGLEKGLMRGREEGRKEGREEGREEGATLQKMEIARNMKAEGSETSFIMKVTGLSEKEIGEL